MEIFSNAIKEIIDDYKNKSNNDLLKALEFLSEDFEFTKTTIIELTTHLENVENLYNKLFEEYNIRTNGNKSIG